MKKETLTFVQESHDDVRLVDGVLVSIAEIDLVVTGVTFDSIFLSIFSYFKFLVNV